MKISARCAELHRNTMDMKLVPVKVKGRMAQPSCQRNGLTNEATPHALVVGLAKPHVSSYEYKQSTE